jgi:SSS family solute:Na+ symporter
MALLLPSVIDSLTVFYSLLTVTLTIPIIAGLAMRRPGAPEAAAAVAAGAAGLVAGALGAGSAIGMMWSPVTIGLLLSSFGFGAVLTVRALRST